MLNCALYTGDLGLTLYLWKGTTHNTSLHWLAVSALKIKCCVGELQRMVKEPCTIQHLQDYMDYDSKYNLCYNAAAKTIKTQLL